MRQQHRYKRLTSNHTTVSTLALLALARNVKKQPSQDVLHGDAAEEKLGLAHLVSSYTLHIRTHSLAGEASRQLAVKC